MDLRLSWWEGPAWRVVLIPAVFLNDKPVLCGNQILILPVS
jgi:hypothetical protein